MPLPDTSATPGIGHPASIAPAATRVHADTDAVGLDCGPVEIPAGDIALPAYVARPHGGAELPVILVVSEIFGVHAHIADIARRFAKLGHLAIAPDLFVRQGDATSCQEVDRLVAEIVEKTPDVQVMSDLDACITWAAANGGNTGRLGITGFCWGGRITWMYAAHQPAVRAGVAWYGKLKVPPTAQKPRHPVDVAEQLRAPVLGLYGGKDESIPPEHVEAMRRGLAAGAGPARDSAIVVYPDAGHAFMADYRASYRADAAADGWRRCVDWLARHGA